MFHFFFFGNHVSVDNTKYHSDIFFTSNVCIIDKRLQLNLSMCPYWQKSTDIARPMQILFCCNVFFFFMYHFGPILLEIYIFNSFRSNGNRSIHKINKKKDSSISDTINQKLKINDNKPPKSESIDIEMWHYVWHLRQIHRSTKKSINQPQHRLLFEQKRKISGQLRIVQFTRAQFPPFCCKHFFRINKT